VNKREEEYVAAFSQGRTVQSIGAIMGRLTNKAGSRVQIKAERVVYQTKQV